MQNNHQSFQQCGQMSFIDDGPKRNRDMAFPDEACGNSGTVRYDMVHVEWDRWPEPAKARAMVWAKTNAMRRWLNDEVRKGTPFDIIANLGLRRARETDIYSVISNCVKSKDPSLVAIRTTSVPSMEDTGIHVVNCTIVWRQ